MCVLSNSHYSHFLILTCHAQFIYFNNINVSAIKSNQYSTFNVSFFFSSFLFSFTQLSSSISLTPPFYSYLISHVTYLFTTSSSYPWLNLHIWRYSRPKYWLESPLMSRSSATWHLGSVPACVRSTNSDLFTPLLEA